MASALEHEYRHYRFTPTQLRSGTTIQLSHFHFLNESGNPINMAGVAVSNPGGSNAPDAGEGIQKLIDHNDNGTPNTGTKWLTTNFAGKPVYFDFGTPVTTTGYDFATANDAVGRDPVSWTVEGSEDGNNWVLLDEVLLHAMPWNRFTFIGAATGGFHFQPTIISRFTATPAVVLDTDNVVELDWRTHYADGGVTISPEPGLVHDGSGEGSLRQDIEEVESEDEGDTTYTLTATNTGDGDHSKQVTVRVVEGGTANFQYVRFVPLKLRYNALANSVQLAELRFLNQSGQEIPVEGVSAPRANSPAAESADKLYDADLTTKWLDFNKADIIFDLGEDPADIHGYYLVTGNDSPERDPVRWIIEGSDNPEGPWTLIDNMTAFDFPTPFNRGAYTQDIPLPGPSSLAAIDTTPAISAIATIDNIPVISTLTGSARIAAGGEIALVWNAAGGAVTLTGVGAVPSAGRLIVEPAESTTYVLTVTGPDDEIVTSELAVEVVEPVVAGINYTAPNYFNDADDSFAFIGSALIVNDPALSLPDNTAERLRITPNQGGLNGTAWHRDRVEVVEGFDTTFGLHFIAPGGGGADGMAFVVQNHPLGTLARPLNTNERGLHANALNVSFDSFGNAEEPGEISSHAAIRVFTGATYAGQTADLTVAPPNGLGIGDLTQTNVNAEPYQVRVTYVPGSLNVWVNGFHAIRNLDVDLEEIGAVAEDGKAWMGFTARTGGLAETHDVTDWRVVEGAPSSPLQLLGHSINPATGEISLTWSSSSERTYRITSSTDLLDWSTVLKQEIPGGAGAETTDSVSFPPETKQFFRVEEE